MPKDDLPIIAFETVAAWETWLAENQAQPTGIWLRIFKKDSNALTVTYPEALDAALCWGWIDGQKNKYDADSYLQKFTARRKNSIWSKINTNHVERLTETGKMQPAGLREVAEAKADGRWQKAYDSYRNMEMPADFLRELEKTPQAKAFFETLNKTNLFSIAFRLQTAKRAETRDKRMREILEMLSNGKKFH